ncbi:MerR family transcriptional regulator [Niallia sp. 03133]|uniref:MerR family transcriptional regulator n=1 Tax=Niallia sp. 03133 TaxID=3458060 RepID=UPI004043D902
MKCYSIFEVSKKLTTSPNTIKKWEKDLKDVLFIPRTKNGARYYTEKEVHLLGEAKSLYKNKIPKTVVKERLTMMFQPKQEINQKEAGVESKFLELVESQPKTKDPIEKEAVAEHNMKVFLSSLESYKQEFLEDVKEEIRKGIRNEVMENIKKEIRTSQAETASAITQCLDEKIKENLEDLTNTLHTNADQNKSNYEDIRTNIYRLSKLSKAERKAYSKQWTFSHSSSSEIKSMIGQLSKSNEEINKSVEQLHHNNHYILETLQQEREQLHQNIREREQSFQDLVQSFRTSAENAGKRKQWWHFW